MNKALSEALKNKAGLKNTKRRFYTKGQAHEYFEAKYNKKKLPTFKHKHPMKDPKFAALSIKKYENKYPSFND